MARTGSLRRRRRGSCSRRTRRRHFVGVAARGSQDVWSPTSASLGFVGVVVDRLGASARSAGTPAMIFLPNVARDVTFLPRRGFCRYVDAPFTRADAIFVDHVFRADAYDGVGTIDSRGRGRLGTGATSTRTCAFSSSTSPPRPSPAALRARAARLPAASPSRQTCSPARGCPSAVFFVRGLLVLSRVRAARVTDGQRTHFPLGKSGAVRCLAQVAADVASRPCPGSRGLLSTSCKLFFGA